MVTFINRKVLRFVCGAVVQPGTTLGSRKYKRLTDPHGNEEFLERGNPNIEGSNPSGPTFLMLWFSVFYKLTRSL
jgi:hypothetical protein